MDPAGLYRRVAGSVVVAISKTPFVVISNKTAPELEAVYPFKPILFLRFVAAVVVLVVPVATVVPVVIVTPLTVTEVTVAVLLLLVMVIVAVGLATPVAAVTIKGVVIVDANLRLLNRVVFVLYEVLHWV